MMEVGFKDEFSKNENYFDSLNQCIDKGMEYIKWNEKLEKYKSQMAKQATARVKEEAQQTYERMAAEAKAQGIEVELKAKALKNNPFVAQYELAKAIQKWNGELNLPQTLTMMEGANSSGTIIPFLKIGK